MTTGSQPNNPSRDPPDEPAERGASAGSLGQVQRALKGLRYGTVTIIVQDGVVVQIDRTEKTRLR